MRYTLRLLLALLIALTSCSDNNNGVVIKKEFNNEEWSRFDYLHGDFDVKKAPAKYDIVMEVTVSDVFPNIYETHQDNSALSFNLTISNPNGNGSRSRNYSFYLRDKDGNWKSENVDGYYHFKLPIIGDMTFSEEGAYKFKVENKYPKDPLHGIKDITIKCINTKTHKQ